MNTPNRAAAQATDTDHPHGMALLRDPLLNKGTAFTEQERDALGCAVSCRRMCFPWRRRPSA
jgi:malate dehydrogenase (oxaloacetate-decarboxylating)(NADP+)